MQRRASSSSEQRRSFVCRASDMLQSFRGLRLSSSADRSAANYAVRVALHDIMCQPQVFHDAQSEVALALAPGCSQYKLQ